MGARPKPGPRPSLANEPPSLPRASCRGQHPTSGASTPCPPGEREQRARGKRLQSPPGVPVGICRAPSRKTKLLPSAAWEPSNSPSIASLQPPCRAPGKARADGAHPSPGARRGSAFRKGQWEAPGAWHPSSKIITASIRSCPAHGELWNIHAFCHARRKVSSVPPLLSLLLRSGIREVRRAGALPPPCPSHPPQEPEADAPWSQAPKSGRAHGGSPDTPGPFGRTAPCLPSPGAGQEPRWSGIFGASPPCTVPPNPGSPATTGAEIIESLGLEKTFKIMESNL